MPLFPFQIENNCTFFNKTVDKCKKTCYNGYIMEKGVNMEKVNIFSKGPTIVFGHIKEAAEWICSDWPEGAGFQSSDRNAVFRDALRNTIGAANAEAFFKGQLDLNETELSMFKTGVNNAISDVFAQEAI
jgi:hypothetical protein